MKSVDFPSHLPATTRTRVNLATFSLVAPALPDVALSLTFAEQVRRALIRNRVDTSHSEAIVGKTVDGLPLAGHLHAHYLVSDEDGDGRLDHLTVYAPRGLDESDVAALWATRTIFRCGHLPEVRLVLTGLGDAAEFTGLPLFAKAKRWRSATPFSLPRFASRGGGKPPRPRDLPEAQLQRELRLRGLPKAVAIKRIDGYQVNDRPLVRWLDFHTRRFKGDEGYGLAGFEIEFAETVQGPVALGFASHFSLGLFVPALS